MILSLLGYGKTTEAISSMTKCNIFDDKAIQISQDKYGNTIYPSSEIDNHMGDTQIPSPGIRPSSMLIKKSTNLISEYDFFADKMPLSIWVSGTNGKTTLSGMIEILLRDKGAEVGGNIGVPLGNMNIDSSMWILETSSFTLAYTKKARPNIYILLPITPDHLDWHGSFEEYEKSKLSPLARMQEGEIAILPRKYKNTKTNAHIIYYDDSDSLAEYFDLDSSKIDFKEPFLLDAVLSLCVEKILFFNASFDKINSYKIDSHKLEEIKDTKNRLWVNDSKATNIDASEQAIKRYKDKKIHLILGGDNKGIDLEPFIKSLQDYQITIYAIGLAKTTIMDLAKKHNIKYIKCLNLKESVKKISHSLNIDEVALLSPACASIDEFNSYKHRGEEFIKEVLSI